MDANGDIGQVVGNEVRTEHVAFVHRGPQLTRPRTEVEAVGIAQPCAENALAAGFQIDLPDQRATLFDLHPVFADVGLRPDRGIQPIAIGMQREIAHPVTGSLGEVGDLAPLPGQFGTAERIIECKHFIVVGDVKRIVAPCDARRRIEVIT